VVTVPTSGRTVAGAVTHLPARDGGLWSPQNWAEMSAALSPGRQMRPGESESNSGYLAGRKATWIWTATPGAEKPSTSLVL